MEEIDINMSEENKQKLKEYQKNYCEANKNWFFGKNNISNVLIW